MTSVNSERRTQLKIIASILDACCYRTSKTHVMYQCNMSSKQLEVYLDVILKANLLLVENDCRSLRFRVSGKGKDFLKAYSSMMTILE